MFAKDLQREFYSEIYGKQCLIFVNFDIDAICASKILQTLLKHDNMVYTLVPIQGVKDMVKAFEDNSEQVTVVVMINCGGTLDIVELLNPPEEITFFILDSHRPYDLCNVYSERQIKILGSPESEEDIPDYNDIFKDDSEDEEENLSDVSDDENESRQAKRQRLMLERATKRKELREWEENRDNILFNYTQYSFYGKSSAVSIFELSWKMSRDSLDLVWWAIIGSTEQAILSKVESNVNFLEAGKLQGHVSRLSHIGGDGERQLSAIKVTYDKDLLLALYRHWTVEDSLKHSLPTAVALRLWSIKGDQKLKELLAEMGLPLSQSKQRFSAMDLSLRQEFKESLQKLASKYRVDSIVGASFTLQYGYRFKYCASDIVYAMLAILESTSKDRSPKQCFMEASECLSRMKKEVLDGGIEKAKHLLSQIFKAAQNKLDMKHVINAGSFLYVVLSDGIVHSNLFSHPHTLIMLANFILKAYVESSRNKRLSKLPLVASATFDEETEMAIIVGIPPVSEDQPRSLFGRAFEQAALNTNSTIDLDYFDTTVAKLKIEDRPKFFDALAALLV